MEKKFEKEPNVTPRMGATLVVGDHDKRFLAKKHVNMLNIAIVRIFIELTVH